MTLQVEAAGLTHRGSARKTNEDCLSFGAWSSQENMESACSFENVPGVPFACVVADGMGGHNDGELASHIVATRLAPRLDSADPGKIASALHAVNAELYDIVALRPEFAGMGSTVVGLCQDGASIAIFNVGDSRAYRVEGEALVQLSVDDSEHAGWKPGSPFARSGMLTQCFGGYTEFSAIQPHVHIEACIPGRTYLLCSDGLYEALDEEQLLAMIGGDLAGSVDAIFRAALKAFASDNVTIALVRVSDKAPA
jgi:serine/threonine protein phosphatase PrpC